MHVRVLHNEAFMQHCNLNIEVDSMLIEYTVRRLEYGKCILVKWNRSYTKTIGLLRELMFSWLEQYIFMAD